MSPKRVAYILPTGASASGIPDAVMSDEVGVDVVDSTASVFPASTVELLVTEVSALEAAVRAARLGYDGNPHHVARLRDRRDACRGSHSGGRMRAGEPAGCRGAGSTLLDRDDLAVLHRLSDSSSA